MSYLHLTKDDRVSLYALLKEDLTQADCARNIGVSPTTISRELSGNGGRKHYRPRIAHRKYLLKRKEANQCHRKLGRDKNLTKLVIRLLKKDWSPEQIVGRTRLELEIKLTSATSIYNYVNPIKELTVLLPRKHNKYRRRHGTSERIKIREEMDSKRSIDLRPKAVGGRKTIGHWEGDTLVGRERKVRILTHVERKSGYLKANLLTEVSAGKIKETTVKTFKNLSPKKRKSITYDRGLEFSEHELTEKELKNKIYFAHAYHAWERGTNENTNGLLRRYFPKKTLFNTIDIYQLKQCVKKINHRPRKRLGFKTPYEIFYNIALRTLI